MAQFKSGTLSLLVGLSLGFAACGKDKKAAEDEGETLACETVDDCEAGWVCLDGECANAASGAIYTDTTNAVTPDKVQRQVDSIQEKSQKRADELLDGL